MTRVAWKDCSLKESGSALAVGQWYNLVVVRRGETIYFYENGVQTPSTPTAMQLVAPISEKPQVAVWNTALTNEEIDKLREGIHPMYIRGESLVICTIPHEIDGMYSPE